MATQTQKKAMFFVFDGGLGIGHLRRIARLAKRLQGRFACLIVTGHRAAADWFVPAECEYIRLPSWDGLLESKARYWGRKPFILLDEAEAVRLRKDILRPLVEAFRPDVIFVDHLPLGSRNELEDIIRNAPCLKYLVTRGILNETGGLPGVAGIDRQLVLSGKAYEYLRLYYHRLLVASDSKVFDFSTRYNIVPDIRQKTIQTGYIIDSVSQQLIKGVRKDRGLESGETWVVASVGGGQFGEKLIERCVGLARVCPNIAFDIILGPRSRFPWKHRHRTVVIRGNLRLHKEVSNMPYLHASADLVISSGGYNSILETLQGNAKILCFPTWKDQRDEQYHHASCLKEFVDIQVSTDLSELPVMFNRTISSIRNDSVHDRRKELDFDGATAIKRIVLKDLGLRTRQQCTDGNE
jgi:predicted glycosyltransferase